MRKWLGILAAAFLVTPATAQDDAPTAEAGGSFLERQLESLLSGAGRQVIVSGFEGALSSTARLDEMTIADESGVWLILRDAELDWNRGALLRGRLEVNRLTAGEIRLPRLPEPQGRDLPAPEATPFALPELPVAIEIGELSVASVSLGAPILGEAATVSLAGQASLSGGEGEAEISVERIDGTEGRLALSGRFENATEALALDVSLSEPAGGIAARALGLPGEPSVDLSVSGDGVLSDFAADLRLATGGQERLTGTLRLLADAAEDPAVAPDRRFEVDLGGDLAPVVAPQFAPFFGDDIRLAANGTAYGDRRLELESFELGARSMQLSGRLSLDRQRAPEIIELTGTISDPDGGDVLLPAGRDLRVGEVMLDIGFDAATGPDWTGRITLADLDTPDGHIEELALIGTGRIDTDAAGAEAVTADLDFSARGLALDDMAAQAALGPEIGGSAQIGWQRGAPVILHALRLSGDAFSLDGSGRIDGSDATFAGDIQSEDLAAFSDLAQRPLGGRAELRVDLSAGLTSGAFDVAAEGRTSDLTISQEQFDRTFAGRATLDLAARRDETGTTLERLELTTPQASLSATARLTSDASSARADLDLADAARIDPRLSGPASVELTARGQGDSWDIETQANLLGAELSYSGRISDLSGDAAPHVAGVTRIAGLDLARLAAFLDRPLAGIVSTRIEGEARIDQSAFDISALATTDNIVTGIEQADGLLTGRTVLTVAAHRAGSETVLEGLSLANDTARLTASGRLGAGMSRIVLDARVSDAAQLDQRLSGPATVALTAEGGEEGWDVDAEANVFGADLAYRGRISDLDAEAPIVAGTARLDRLNLARIAALAGRPLSGEVSARIDGRARTNQDLFDLTVDLTGQDIGTGIPEADLLLQGASSAGITATKTAPGQPIRISRFTLDTPRLTARAEGSYGGGESDLTVSARLSDVAPFAPGLSGPISAEGRLGEANDRISVALDATGPGGIRADVAGTASVDFRDFDLDIAGAAPLALANRFISPQSLAGTAEFDLSLNGSPGLSALSGRVTTSGARAVLPGQSIVFEDIAASLDLGGSAARIALTATKQAGGSVTVNGSVGLAGALPADLTVELQRVVFQDPALYRTTASGRLRLVGAIRNGATASGRIDLDTSEVRVPSSGLGLAGPIPDLIHVNQPPAVRATRARAELIGNGGNGTGDGGGAIGLDIVVVAENRIFVRGRGLDAELGGRLGLGGTSAEPIPSGRFDLIRGRLDILGQRLDLDEGSIALQGDFSPLLRLVARTQADDGTVLEVVLEGPANAPEITFASQPELPEDEVLARLLFGKSLTNISPLQAARLASAAATLAGRGGEGVVGRLRSQFGLSDLDITTDDDGNAALRAGLYLSENIYSDVTVSAGGDTEINLNLDLTPSLRARGRVTNSGETSLGLFYERDY